MTVPEAAAWIAEPYVAPMSMPSCMRPQRNPNGLVTGPEAGQIRPADDGVDDGPLLECCAWAAWMRAVSAALEACRESISSASARSEAESCERSVSFCCFVLAIWSR